MEASSMSQIEMQSIPGEIVPSGISELFIDERNGEYLILNALGPWWFISSKIYADFIRLCDGKRSIGEIYRLLSPIYKGLTIEHLININQTLIDENFFSETEKLPIRPLSMVFFSITKRCNLSCPYCYYDSVPPESNVQANELDSDTWIGLAGNIAEINPRAKIFVSGGEPMIRPDAIDIIKGISEKGLEVKLITNGTLFNQEMVSDLSKIDKFSVQVSIDSIIPEENSQTRGAGSLEKALQALRWMKDAGIDIIVSATLTQINSKNLPKLRDYCNQNGYYFRMSGFSVTGEKSKKNAKRLDINPEELSSSAIYVPNFVNGVLVLGYPLFVGERRYSCGFGHGQIDIGPDGLVSPCGYLSQPEFSIGNVRRLSLLQLLERGYSQYGSIDVDKIEPCTSTKCPVRYICGGGCRANSMHDCGTMYKAPRICSYLKQAYIDALWISAEGPSGQS